MIDTTNTENTDTIDDGGGDGAMGDDDTAPTAPMPERNPWRVARGSGFATTNSGGDIGLIQINAVEFEVTHAFDFEGEAVGDIERRLIDAGVEPDEARRRVDAARTFTPRQENPTDLASIPPFMRWFENSYGLHTLAAILHDEQIVDRPNEGSLRSDALADRFFREMLGAAGVPWLKRWIMWSAVALRSRWVAGGRRRAQLLAWIGLALIGITAFVAAIGRWVGVWDPGIAPGLLVATALVLPFAAAPLWGKQIGAGLVAAVAAAWVLPAAVFGLVGLVVYRGLERVAAGLGLD